MRLQKYMALCGIGSRRKCEKYIEEARVKVNGQIVTKMGYKIDPSKDKVLLDDRLISLNKDMYYVLLNKPKGVITSVKDQYNRRTVLDLLEWTGPRIYPVGRLDYNTEGLILLTNDGDLANKMTHPKYGFEKEYFCIARGHINREKIDKLKKGIDIGGYITSPAKAKLEKYTKENSEVRIVIREGRNRQVRRMFDSIGHPIIYLRRERIGEIGIGDLKTGEWRFLEDKEINILKDL